ncbi:MAG: MBL fold metallo-hydrolase [Methermicoccaceae archaeon]
MLAEHIPPSGASSNVYLVGDVLVDAGMDAGVVLDHLRRRGTRLRLIVLTHAHYDHTAAAGQIAEHTGALVAVSRADADHLTDPRYSLAHIFGKEGIELEPDILLSQGDVVEAGGVSLEVVSTPGHTAGSICLFEPVSASLFSGDTVYANGGFGRCDFPTGSCERLLRSLDALRMLHVNRLYPGHGEVVHERAFEHIELAYEIARTVLG